MRRRGHRGAARFFAPTARDRGSLSLRLTGEHLRHVRLAPLGILPYDNGAIDFTIALAILVAVVAYGFYTSLAGQALFSGKLFED